jgi:LysM repeat protein
VNKPPVLFRFITREKESKILLFRSSQTSNHPLTITTMNPIKFAISSAIALALASCATKNEDAYDTSSPYGPADGSADSAPYQSLAPADQTYDTPAEYEVGGNTPSSPNIPASPSPSAPSVDAAPATIATTHTVVTGDTLGGIARKYKVSIASIKAANNMTSDVVVLGKKLKIPAP